MQIVPCGDHFEELVQFAARLNSDAAHHIGFFGEGEADIRASLAECVIPPAQGFLLAHEDDHLVGVFGVDINPEIQRAWLFGPLVEHADWHPLADELYQKVLPLIPADIQEYDLYCDENNVHLDTFAVRHGFSLRSQNALMSLERGAYKSPSKTKAQIVPFGEKFFDAFEKLHNTLFPNTYFTAQQAVEKISATRKLFLAIEDGNLLGYHFCKIEPEAELGYIDFIGTDKSARRRGIGADLLASGLDWMLAAPTTKRINLTVNADNVAAIKLYEKFGFVAERVMRGYRKRVA